MTRIEYNSNVIHEFAQRMYDQANWIIATYTIIGALIGSFIGGFFRGAVGVFFGILLHALFRASPQGLPNVRPGESTRAAELLGLVILGAIGYHFGKRQALWLKLQAQTALCQAKIEENTRKSESP